MIGIQAALQKVVERVDLTEQEMEAVMHAVMSGATEEAQIGGLLVALRMKGETVAEITGAARAMRALATPVALTDQHAGAPLVDTCGTGGDGSQTFNISTTAAFVVAAAGGRVAKHGNRSVSSVCGSADVLERAGVNLMLSADQVARCVDALGVGFMFAPSHHGAMRHAIGPRKALGMRTLFNVLGPLTNPAGARRQVMGVFSRALCRPIAEVLQRLGAEHVMVVHSADGMDEISIGAETWVAEATPELITEYSVTPEQFGITRSALDGLQVADVDESLAMLKGVLNKQPGAAADIVALNAGAAIYVSGLADTLEQGVIQAQDAIGSGLAAAKLNELVQLSNVYAEEAAKV